VFPINHPKSKKIIGVSLPLSLGIENLDSLLGGLSVGELALLEGDSSALSLSHLLCVRSQLLEDGGGLGSSVVWIDLLLEDCEELFGLFGYTKKRTAEILGDVEQEKFT